MATRALQAISETALQVRRCPRASDEHEALRWVAQFVDEFEGAPEADRPGLVADEPAGTGDPHWDAMLAGGGGAPVLPSRSAHARLDVLAARPIPPRAQYLLEELFPPS